MRLSDAFELYRQDRIIFANKSHKTEEQNHYAQNSLLNHLKEDIPLKDLDLPKIRAWKQSLDKRGLVSGTVRGYIISLRVVLTYMQRLGHECLDPELIIIPKRIDRVPHVITPDDIRKLLKTVSQTTRCNLQTKLRNKAIISLLYSSGIRASELCSLNREDVKQNCFSVNGKGNKSRLCFIDARAREYLDQYLSSRTDQSPALFLDNQNGTRLKAGTLQSMFRRLSTRAKVDKPIHPHTLRHSYATDLMKNGCHIYTLSRLMGHSNISTTQIYLHLYDAELAEAYNKFHSL